MACPKVEQIGCGMICGEGPHWDHNAKVLYYVDVKGCTVNKYNPACNEHTTAKIEGDAVTLIIPIEGKKDQFVISVGRSLAIMTWDGVSCTPCDVQIVTTVDTDPKKVTNRFNDGKADPTGRLWAGTMAPDLKAGVVAPNMGSFYSFDKCFNPTTHLTEVSISNGLAWSQDLKHMYFIDSAKFTIDVFDFDVKTPKISNRRVVFDLQKNGLKGLPDGMTIDTEGKLWVAVFDGSGVLRVDPTNGKLLTKIDIPSPQTTSVTFGGPELDELYVTSANFEQTPEQLKPGSGGTFRITGTGAKGYPGQNFKL
ncbi:hypothetical protein L9F63_008849 [Diploptera punctata]|uniref:Regucalcin n=1 Tax=Diploptera punctata TaxID=6984 RepID=A0AAD7Z4R9_DIPPU|nr:hypothetical protein L9F63_008849 [Diploptera punctata]